VQRDDAAVLAFEPLAQRLEQPREHERQRLELVERPLELERLLEARGHTRRHQRARVFAARQPLPAHALLPQPRRQFGRRQRRHIAERAETPSGEDRDWGLGVGGWGTLGFRL
jgi:hypothetical protein